MNLGAETTETFTNYLCVSDSIFLFAFDTVPGDMPFELSGQVFLKFVSYHDASFDAQRRPTSFMRSSDSNSTTACQAHLVAGKGWPRYNVAGICFFDLDLVVAMHSKCRVV